MEMVAVPLSKMNPVNEILRGLHQAGIFDAFGKLNLQVAMNGVVLHIAGLNGWQMKQWFLISGFAFSYWCLDFCSNQSLLSL